MAALILPLRSCLVHIFLVALIPSNTAAIGDYQYQVPCPSDPSLLGYTSIADLNSEMKRHAGLLWNFWMQADSNQQKEPQQLYQYTLCPHTIFDGTEQLNPLLDRTWIRCGRETVNGSKNQCIIRGGKTQVLMIDQGYNSMATTTNEEDKGPERIFVFQGITFTESQDISIAAFATGGTRAEFIDCHWKNSKGTHEILIAPAHPVMLPGSDPELTFHFDSNIFRVRSHASNRNLQKEEDNFSSDGMAPMTVSLSDCTVQENQSRHPNTTSSTLPYKEEYPQLYSAITTFGALELQNVTFSNLQDGLFVVNSVGGLVVADQTKFYHNQMAGAIVRGIRSSDITLVQCLFEHNFPNVATIATLQNSVVELQGTSITNHPNSGRFVNILLLQNALGIVKDSCLVQDIDMVVSQLSQSRVVGIFMDSSSELEHDRVYSNAFVLSWQDGEDEDIYFCHDILFLESSSLDCLTKPGNSPSSTSIHSYLEEFCPGATTTCKALPTMEAKQCSLQAIENTENYWNELEMEEENMGSPGPALRWITSFLWATTTMASMLV